MASHNMQNNGKVNPDLVRERQKCTFRLEELTNYIDGSPEATEERRAQEEYFLGDPNLKPSQIPNEYLSHKEKYQEAMRMSVALFRRVRQLQDEKGGSIDHFRAALGGSLGSALLNDGNPITLHYVMFIPTIMGQASPDQIVEWFQRAWNLEIIGTYAQTELGHGTFIRGLETTATYDEKTEEFILHSPTLTAYKWWPGGLGHASNYAIIMAQLYTKGKCYGIHPFIVQLRDEETNVPMKGIKIGEIGVKLGMNGTNQGYLGFEKVRIPRKQMLMKNNKVLKDGTYIKAPSSKLTYGTMIFVRVVIVEDAAQYLKKAVIIATRYSAVRKQGQIKEAQGEPETQIIDFLTQQYKLFPLIATFFAFYHSAKWIWNLYNQITGEMEEGQLDRLPELHAISCCLKAVSTADCATGVETCRMACGGHGYMISSNLPTTYGLVTAACTYEGENTVLLLQTARYLIKSYQSCLEGAQLTPTVAYMQKYRNVSTPPFQRRVEWIIQALEKVAACKIAIAYDGIQKRVKAGRVYEHAWNETSIELAAASDMHCRVNVLAIFNEKVQTSKSGLSTELGIVLQQLLELYAVFTAIRFSGDLLRFTNTLGHDINELQAWLEELLAGIRPNAIGIVDGFDVRDEIVHSTLGSYDGNVYERLFAEAQKSPLNQEPVNKSFHEHLKPFLKSNM